MKNVISEVYYDRVSTFAFRYLQLALPDPLKNTVIQQEMVITLATGRPATWHELRNHIHRFCNISQWYTPRLMGW